MTSNSNQLTFSINVRDNASKAINTVRNNINSLKSGIAKIGSGFSSMKSETESATSNVKSLNTEVNKSPGLFNRAINSIKSFIGVVGGLSIVRNIFGLITGSISTAVQRIDTMDLFSQKMEMITGSAEQATSALEQLKTSTKGTPYALDIAAKSVQNFVTRGMETQNAVDSVNIWMDAVSAYGKGTNEQFESVMDAIAKMRTKGTVEMRYLNRLFAAGINPVQMYAKATGQSAEEVQTALSDKTISSADFLDTVETAMREGTNGVLKVEGMAKELAGTWAATLANMRIAFARGMANIIQALDDSFKVFDEKNGLRGMFKGLGTTAESVMNDIAGGIKVILPPILNTAKSAYDYWINYYFNPLKEYFDNFVNPIKQSMETIKNAFRVDGEADINGLVQALNFQGNDNLRDTLLEVVMTWENVKKIARDTWNGLVKQDQEKNQPQAFGFDLDASVYEFLLKVDDFLGEIKSRIPALVTAVYDLGGAFKNAFGGAIELILTVAGGITEFTLALAGIIVPPAMTALTNIFSVLTDLLNIVTQAVKNFVKQNLPNLIDNIITKLSEIKNSAFVQSLIKAFQTLRERIQFVYDTTKNYVGFLNNKNPFTYTTEIDQQNIIKIVDSFQKLARDSVKALEPIRIALSAIFESEVSSNGVKGGFSSILNGIARLSQILAAYIPIIIQGVANLAAKVILYLRPVGEWFFNLAVNYIAPFAESAIRAFFSLLTVISPLVQSFGELITTIASFVIPAALTLFTNICNWIADNANTIVAAVLGIVAAFLTFKAITTVTTIISNLSTVLTTVVIPAVTTFFEVMTTQGIAAAISTLINPVVLIPVAIAALVGLAVGLIYLYNTSDTAKEKIDNFAARFASSVLHIQVSADQVSETFKQIGDAIKGFIDIVNKALKKIDEFFDSIPEWVRALAKLPLKGVGFDLGNMLGSKDGEAYQIQLPTFESNTGDVSAKTQDYLNKYKETVDADKPNIENVGNQYIQSLKNATDQALQENGAIDPSPLTSIIDGMPSNALLQGMELGTNLGVGANNAIDAQGPIDTSQLTSNIVNFPTVGAEAGTKTINSLTSAITENQGAVTEATGAVGGAALSNLNSTLAGDPSFQAGVSFINTFNTGFLANAPSSYQLVAAFVNNIITQLTAGFAGNEDIPMAIAVAMTEVVTKVTADVGILCENIRTQLATAKVSAETTTNALAEAIQSNFATAQISANASLEQMKLDIISQYNQIKDTVESDLSEIEGIQDTFSINAINDFKSRIDSGLEEVKGIYDDLSDHIETSLQDLLTYHSGMASNIMLAFKTGLESKAKDVAQVESDIVKTLKTTFETGLGIHSPSEQFNWYGQMVIAGLIQGMSGDQVTKFINNMIGDMQTSFESGHFNANELVNFLSDDATLSLIGKVSGIDTKNLSEQQIAYPLVGTMGTQTSWFGYRPASDTGGVGSTNHGGADLAAPTGTPIAAAIGGQVSVADWYGGYGNAVRTETGDLSIIYGHMSQIGATVGQQVQKGQVIGYVGSTGNSTGPHLHFEMRRSDTQIDPQPYLEGAGLVAGGNTLAGAIQNAYNAKHGIVSASNLGTTSVQIGEITKEISAAAQQWAPYVLQVLQMLGQPASYLNGVLYAIDSESTGNPNAINLTDSNAWAGHPSQGLLQTIPSTFEAYRNPALPDNIVDPLANIYAGLNYMIHTGGIAKIINDRIGGWVGYAVGTRYVPQDMLAMIHEGEAIIPASQNPYRDSGGDYLSNMFSSIFNNNLSSLGFNNAAMTNNGTQNENEFAFNGNIIFNVTNNNDTDGDRFIGNLESELVRILDDGFRSKGV